jgi:PAS domain S-box-containing protein
MTAGDEQTPADREHGATGAAELESLRRSHEALRELYRISAEPDLSDDERIERMLEVGRERLGVPNGYLSTIDPEGDDYDIEVAVGEGGVETGDSFDFSRTYCRRTVGDDEVRLLANVEETVWADDIAHETHGLSCYVGGRVDVDGELYGTVCFSGTESREPFTEDERTLVELLVEWIGNQLERRRFERERRERREAIEAAGSAITVAEETEDGRPLTFANSGFEALTGYDRSEVLGHDCQFLQGPETDPERATDIGRALDAGEPVETVVRNYRADGEPFWNELRISPIAEDGEVVRYVGTQRDVTERVERQEAMTALLDRTRALLDSETGDEVARTAADAVEEVLGYDCLVRLYDDERDVLVPVAGTGADVSAVEPVAVGQSLSGSAYERDETLTVGDASFEPGGYGHQAGTTDGLVVPLGDHGTLGIEMPTGVADDFDRRLAEILGETIQAALERAASRSRLGLYETAIEQGSGMACVVGSDWEIELASEQLAAFFGWDREYIEGTRVRHLLPEADIGRLKDELSGIQPGDRMTFETSLPTADGDRRPVELDVSMVDSIRTAGVVVVSDIAELERTRGELTRERERLTSLFALLPDPVNEVSFVDGEPVLERCNGAFAEAFGGGRTPEELVGERANDLVRPPEDTDDDPGTIDEQVATGEAVTEEVRRVTDDGPRDFLFRAVPYRVDGEFRAFGIYTDVTEQRRRERRVEVLNRVLRHNLRNQLNIAEGNARLVADRVDDEGLQAPLDSMVRAIGSVLSVSEKARTIERALAGETDGGPSPAALARSVVERHRGANPAATIDLALPTEPVAVADAGRLEPILENLVENALEHTGENVHVRVSLTVADGRLRIAVADDGPGVPDLERALLNDEVEITQLRHGDGIGLWAVRWLADAMGGEVRFEDDGDRHAVVVTVPTVDD